MAQEYLIWTDEETFRAFVEARERWLRAYRVDWSRVAEIDRAQITCEFVACLLRDHASVVEAIEAQIILEADLARAMQAEGEPVPPGSLPEEELHE